MRLIDITQVWPLYQVMSRAIKSSFGGSMSETHLPKPLLMSLGSELFSSSYTCIALCVAPHEFLFLPSDFSFDHHECVPVLSSLNNQLHNLGSHGCLETLSRKRRCSTYSTPDLSQCSWVVWCSSHCICHTTKKTRQDGL